MAIVKEPTPLPSDLNYVPVGSTPYQVTSGDSWWTLAERPDVNGTGMSANNLCYFNFKTRKPAEINWYLYRKVGCRRTTADGKNYMFSAADRPGIVYLPKIGPPKPVNEFPPKPADRTNAWFGIGATVGTMVAVAGIETLVGYVASLDEPKKGMAVTASINRLGVGWGASTGLCFIYITGVSSPQKLNGYQNLDKDFNLALGANWGKVVQGARKIKKLKPLIDFVTKLGVRTPIGLKAALKAHPDKWVELIKAGKMVKEYLNIDPNGERNVFTFPVPVPTPGLEASAFYGLSNYEAAWDFTD